MVLINPVEDWLQRNIFVTESLLLYQTSYIQRTKSLLDSCFTARDIISLVGQKAVKRLAAELLRRACFLLR